VSREFYCRVQGLFFQFHLDRDSRSIQDEFRLNGRCVSTVERLEYVQVGHSFGLPLR
jgi:hypothetical protein